VPHEYVRVEDDHGADAEPICNSVQCRGIQIGQRAPKQSIAVQTLGKLADRPSTGIAAVDQSGDGRGVGECPVDDSPAGPEWGQGSRVSVGSVPLRAMSERKA
jgi:hypothetical protein